MALIECKKCGKQISDQAKFCVHCGEPVQSETKLCPACKTANPPDARFCSNCGYNFQGGNDSNKGSKTSNGVKSNTVPKWPIVVISIALFAIIAFLTYGILFRQSEKSTSLSDISPAKTEEPSDNKKSVMITVPEEGSYTGYKYYFVESGNEFSIGEEKDKTKQLDVILNDDGTCTFLWDHTTYSGTWLYSKDEIYVKVPGTFDSYGTLANGVLYLHDCPKDGYDLILLKDGVDIDESDIPHVYKPSYVQRAFEEARDIGISKCELNNGQYIYSSEIFYVRVHIFDEDIVHINGKPILISQSALYHSWTRYASAICKGAVDYYTKLDTLSATIDIVPKEPDDAMKKRFGEFLELMGPNMESDEVLNNLNARGVISNLKDSETALEYDILDLTGATKTLGVTQQMLGYALSHIGGAAEFDENSVHITIYHHDEIG